MEMGMTCPPVPVLINAKGATLGFLETRVLPCRRLFRSMASRAAIACSRWRRCRFSSNSSCFVSNALCPLSRPKHVMSLEPLETVLSVFFAILSVFWKNGRDQGLQVGASSCAERTVQGPQLPFNLPEKPPGGHRLRRVTASAILNGICRFWRTSPLSPRA